jgi:hypothetical protein
MGIYRTSWLKPLIINVALDRELTSNEYSQTFASCWRLQPALRVQFRTETSSSRAPSDLESLVT